jgi:hypothetical protein|tara:strand:+ start:574 stop:768 length:195 start_codon:yes stop_codon:yes gene_type:complete
MKKKNLGEGFEKYPDGYWPKIEYWTGLLMQAIKEGDAERAVLCSSKLEYFTGKQKELVDNLTTI